MEGHSPEAALARIDAALARIEAAADRPRMADSALAARHEQLRSAVAESLRALDGLIGAQPR